MPQYSGIWTEQAVMQAVGAGNWPGNPGAPTIGTATAGDASASVTFTAPTDNGGSAITGYTVTSSPGGLTGTGASSPITVSGLTNGTAYTFTVRATNATGTGPASAASNSVTPAEPVYIEEVYSTYLYTGNGSTQTITNGIDLSTYGGLVWLKQRNDSVGNRLYDTVRGATNLLESNGTAAQSVSSTGLTAFTSSGFSLGNDPDSNTNAGTYVSWTFREQPKFFDVVTYTGDGTTPREIAHNLTSAPGCVMVKRTDSTTDWSVWHTSTGNDQNGQLNLTNAFGTYVGRIKSVTSTTFTVGDSGTVNASGGTYVAYLFAHNAGGFGLTGTDNVISCGSYTGNGSATGVFQNLGFEPQWILTKCSSLGTEQWHINDNMRGVPTGGSDARLEPSRSVAEAYGSMIDFNATGFTPLTTDDKINGSGQTYIYIVIRRGPMKVPTSGTSVFSPYVAATPGNAVVTTGFPVDFQMQKDASSAADMRFVDRLRGVSTTPTSPSAAFPFLVPSSTAAESTGTGTTLNWNNTGFTVGNTYASDLKTWAVNFRRAPSFFDEVCYTGTGAAMTVPHNLGVAPDLIILKSRNNAEGWMVYAAPLGNNKVLYLNSTFEADNAGLRWNDTTPTSSVFSVGKFSGTTPWSSGAGYTYVAYLFATCAGVSKVGSYTGTGALQTINCGFAAGARFVLIKRTDSTGDWWTYDSARGITSSNDPYLFLNSTAAEVTGTNYVDTTSVGFQVTAAAPADLNASGGTYIFLAIA